MDGTNKHIAILGAGESGVGAAILAKKMGWNVFVSDFGKIKDEFKTELIDNELEWEEENHSEERILHADLVIKSYRKLNLEVIILAQKQSVLQEVMEKPPLPCCSTIF
ncbi:MAG: UDP-N-acetylmuramoyl-L-alanine--D-glutamate ligase [Bacteroidota bacterium]